MKKRLIFNIHSIVDVITNSSSELFVFDTDKSLEFVKEYFKQNGLGKYVSDLYVYTEDTYINEIRYNLMLSDDECELLKQLLEYKQYNSLLSKLLSGYLSVRQDVNYIGKIVLDIDNNNDIEGHPFIDMFNVKTDYY